VWLFRATADELLKEYKACESPDYISYVRALLVVFRPHPQMYSPLVRQLFRGNGNDELRGGTDLVIYDLTTQHPAKVGTAVTQ
jgi:hypothetical protein